MRDTEHFKKHLSIRVQVDGKTINDVPVEDPFHHSTIVHEIGWWDLLRALFRGGYRVEIRVKVVSDGVSQGRWFQGADICERCKRARIDGPGQHETKPGYEHGDERWCEACYYKDPIPDMQNTLSMKGVQQ
jgi:hypothetical protein